MILLNFTILTVMHMISKSQPCCRNDFGTYGSHYSYEQLICIGMNFYNVWKLESGFIFNDILYLSTYVDEKIVLVG